MIKVGQKIGKRVIGYSHVTCDIDGWADAKEFLPADFDLCYVKIKDKQTRPGWVQGTIWGGANVARDDIVLYWKKFEKLKDND